MVDLKVFILLFLICILASDVSAKRPYKGSFQWFMKTYNKTYSSPNEFEYRRKIFRYNMRKIDEFNRSYKANNLFFRCAVNFYADMPSDEFVKLFTGLAFEGLPPNANLTERSYRFTVPTVDWRGKAVTPVKHQRKCGACWSFAAVAALEGQIYLRKKRLVSLSPQNLIDCVETEGTSGCTGGLMTDAYAWIKDNGIMNEKEYQYEAGDNKTCRYKPKRKAAACIGFKNLPHGSEDDLKRAVTTIGPISVGIHAKFDTLQFYSSGVYFEPKCDPMAINHAVLVVGYGTDEHDEDYWIIKNSWGTAWGEKGYLRLARNRKNHCGVATLASYPLV